MRFRAIEIAAATNGDLQGSHVEVTGVTVDSRSVAPRSLFVPIVAARDGDAFIADAVEAGAVAYADGAGAFRCRRSRGRRGRHRRGLARPRPPARGQRLPDRVIGITGSVGKTT